MKRHLFPLLLLALLPLTGSAQSSDARYPEGPWINQPPGAEDRFYSVDITVNRVTEPDKEKPGTRNCGSISVYESKSGKTVYEGYLNYAGRGLDKGVGNGVFYFNVTTPSGQKDLLGLRKSLESRVSIVSLTGSLSSHPFLKEQCFLALMSGSWVPVTIEPCTEKELLESLNEALKDNDADRIAYRTRGFGDVRRYIRAHQGLDPQQPKYAKPIGPEAVKVRKEPSQTAAVNGNLTAGHSMLVVDEYDGWCQVWQGGRNYGWVALNTVLLSNNKGLAQPLAKTSSATAAKPQSFILANGKLGPLRIGQTVASLPKSVAGLYDSYKYETKEIENEMEGSWTEEWCHFYKDGREIFKCFAEGKKLTTFVLLEGSSFIKTNEGFYVGYSARSLFNKKRMKWETYFEGTVFATSGHFIYHINSDDITGNSETPSRVTNIKQTAKICMIVYQ